MSRDAIRSGCFPKAFAAVEASVFDKPWPATAFLEGADRVSVSSWRGAACVGFAHAALAADEAELWRIAVLPAWRRLGLARALLSALIEACRARDAAALHLEVSAHNAAALGLYRAMGFAESGRRKNYYGPGEDAALLRLETRCRGCAILAAPGGSAVKIAFVMDPLEKVNPNKDTTYYIMLAACERGHQVFYLDQRDIWVRDRCVFAAIARVDVHNDMKTPFTRHDPQAMSLSAMDVVMVRTDPPFDRTYLYTTLLLDLLPPSTLVVNQPSGLRNWNEKLAAVHFPDWTPSTLITQNAERILEFLDEFGKITLKPIDGFAGKGIVFLDKDSPNLDQLIYLMTNTGRRRVIAQEYLHAAREGDKRILLLNGEPMGGILRLHAEGKELNNLDAGGTAHPTELTPRDLEICAALKQDLIKEGVFFAGIDILGGQLIEINVTSPTGLQQLCRFAGEPFHHRIIQALEEKLPAHNQKAPDPCGGQTPAGAG